MVHRRAFLGLWLQGCDPSHFEQCPQLLFLPFSSPSRLVDDRGYPVGRRGFPFPSPLPSPSLPLPAPQVCCIQRALVASCPTPPSPTSHTTPHRRSTTAERAPPRHHHKNIYLSTPKYVYQGSGFLSLLVRSQWSARSVVRSARRSPRMRPHLHLGLAEHLPPHPVRQVPATLRTALKNFRMSPTRYLGVERYKYIWIS